MKIYFEDGELINAKKLPVKPDFVINASDGVSRNIALLDNLNLTNKDYFIYTNSILAFSNRYAWNKDLQIPEIYIRDNQHGVFINITHLTNRELKEGHNFAKMYIAGEFN